jgi:hypothetical protein
MNAYNDDDYGCLDLLIVDNGIEQYNKAVSTIEYKANRLTIAIRKYNTAFDNNFHNAIKTDNLILYANVQKAIKEYLIALDTQ